MEKIIFEDLPSTNTPISATNLNAIQTNVEDVFNGEEVMGSIVVDDVNCKNLCDIATVKIGKQWNGGSDANTATVFVPVLPSTQYTISYENNPFTDNYLIEKNGADDTTAVVSAVAITSPTTRTTNANTHYLAISFYKSSGAITQSDFTNFKIQVELGNTNTNIVPYKKIIKEENGYVKENTTFYANDFKCKNLCNGINQSVFLTSAVTSGQILSGNTGLYIKVNGGKYTISTTASQARYRVACMTAEPSTTAQTAYNGVNKDGTSDTITINTSGYNYLIVNATDLSKIQIEIGSEATPYTEYKNFENEDIYSTNEMVIGKWIDGKPLYRKVIEISITTAGDYTYNVANLNIDTPVFFNGYCYVYNQTTTKRPFPYITWNNNANKTLVCAIESFENNNIYCKSNWDNSKIFLSLEYTKTTD